MKHRLRMTLVYFGLVDDPELEAALDAAPLNLWRRAAVAAVVLLAFAGLWLLARLAGVDLGVGVLLLGLAVVGLLLVLGWRLPEDEDDDARAETHPAPPPRSLLRQLFNDAYAYIMLWIVLAFVAQILGRELSDHATGVVLLSIAGFVAVDAMRLLLRRRCGRAASQP